MGRKIRLYVLFLWLLPSVVLVSAGEKIPVEIQLQEAKVAKESAERQVVELKENVSRLQREYAQLRSQYAQLYLRSAAALEQMKNLEIQAQNLMQDARTGRSGATEQQAVELIAVVLRQQLQVQDALSQLEKTLVTFVDVLQPSAALRSELTERTAALKGAVQKSLMPLVQYYRGERSASGPKNCTVLSINKEKGILFLDQGLFSGIRPGTKWRFCDGNGKVLARFLTVDCQTEFSAAAPLEGNLNTISVGSVLLPD